MTDQYWIRMFYLPYHTTEEDLIALISDVSGVQCKVLLANKNEVVRWCWACFSTQEDADKVKDALNGYLWNDNRLYVIA